MNIIIEERQNIIDNNNTAQSQFEGILEKLDKRTATIEIHDPLHGNLDFSILKRDGFTGVKKIILARGEVTAINNLPSTLESLVCDDQFLIELENLPTNLVELSCQHNYIATIDVSKLTKLKKLEISHNRLEKLENIPESLKELYCDDNEIKVLNLRENTNLVTLHTSNNKAIIIEYLPESVIDFKSENNPFIEIQYAKDADAHDAAGEDSEEKIDYIEALNKYFKLKREYEDGLLFAKRNAYQSMPTKKMGRKAVAKIVPKCINCKRGGGTIFEQKDRYYRAFCGHKGDPCPLKIELYNGVFFDLHSTIDMTADQMYVLTEDIIKQKLDTLFNYKTEKASAQIFKELMEDYTYYKNEYAQLLELNHKYYFKDATRNGLIEKKMTKIYETIESIKVLMQEYENTGNTKLLETAVKIQVDELNPEILNVRGLKHKIMDMNVKNYRVKSGWDDGAGDEEHVTETTGKTVFELYQRYADLQQVEIRAYGEPPKVVHFSGLVKQ